MVPWGHQCPDDPDAAIDSASAYVLIMLHGRFEIKVAGFCQRAMGV
jgi:hypothetical protein